MDPHLKLKHTFLNQISFYKLAKGYGHSAKIPLTNAKNYMHNLECLIFNE